MLCFDTFSVSPASLYLDHKYTSPRDNYLHQNVLWYGEIQALWLDGGERIISERNQKTSFVAPLAFRFRICKVILGHQFISSREKATISIIYFVLHIVLYIVLIFSNYLVSKFKLYKKT